MKDYQKHENTRGNQSKKPRKKVSDALKMKNNKAYLRAWLLWVYNETRFPNSFTGFNNPISAHKPESLQDLYEIASGGLPERWFHSVTNKFNLKSLDQGKVENYNLLYKNIQKLLGEWINRPKNNQVENKGPEAGQRELEEKNDAIYMMLADVFNEIKDLPPEEADQILKEREKELTKREEEAKLTYKDAKAYRGQSILNYIKHEDKVDNKTKEMWRHWVISAHAFVQARVRKNEVRSIPLSPLQVDYSRKTQDYDGRKVEDAEWVAVRYRWSVDKVLDELGEYLGENDLTELDQNSFDQLSIFRNTSFEDYTQGLVRYDTHEEVEVVFIRFTIYKKLGLVTYINPLTYEEEQEVVNDGFKLTRQMKKDGWKIEWYWEEEYWQGWVLNGHTTCGIQRSGFDEDGSGIILGMRFNDLHTEPKSIVKLGLPYQKLWLVLWNKLEQVISKSLGEAIAFPVQAVSGQEGNSGWTFEKILEALEKTNILFYDLSDPALRGQGAHNLIGKMNLTAVNEANFYISLMQQVQQAWDNFIGFTPARTGEQRASQPVGSVQAELVQSSDITEFLYNEFEELYNSYLTALLELSKFAFFNDDMKNRQIYVRDDYHTSYLEVDVVDHMLTDYGVFIVNSSKETKELQYMKDIGLQRVNQGASASEVFEMVSADNMATLKKVLNELYNKEQANLEQQQLSEQEHQEKLKQMEQERLQLEADLSIYEQTSIDDNKYAHEKELEYIKAGANQLSFQNTMDANGDGTPDVNELQQAILEGTKLDQQEKDSLRQAQLKNKELNLKNKEINVKKQIEDKKAKVALENKVVGEK